MSSEEIRMLVFDASICQYKGCESGQKSVFYQVRFSDVTKGFADQKPSSVFLT